MEQKKEHDFHSSPEAFLKKCKDDNIDATVALYTFQTIMDSGKWDKQVKEGGGRKKLINDFFHSLPNVVLYHASKTQGLTSLNPNKSSREGDNKSLVFASTSESLTACFMPNAKNDVATKSISEPEMGEDGFVHPEIRFVIGDKDKLIEMDKGGSIYEIATPHTEFTIDPDKGLGALEPTCPHEVELKSEKRYNSAIKAMADGKIELYSPDRKLFDEFTKAKKAKDTSYKTLREKIYNTELDDAGKKALLKEVSETRKKVAVAKIKKATNDFVKTTGTKKFLIKSVNNKKQR